jgi:hypothetical protein
MTEPTLCETRWKEIVASFERNHEALTTNNPACQEEIELLGNGLRTIGQLIHTSPSINGNGAVWNKLIAKSEAERTVLCKHLDGKALFTAMLRLYATIHREMRESLLLEQKEPAEEFREQRRRKRNPSEEQKKKPKPSPSPRDPRIKSQGQVLTKNFFAPLRTPGMDVEETTKPEEQQPSNKSGRPPPIVLTSTTNLMQLQRKVKDIVTGNFEFRNIRNGTRIVTKDMADFSSIKKLLENNNLSYFTFYPKSEKPIKAVIRHLPENTPAEDISDGLVSLGFDVISVKQMTTSRRTPEGTNNINLPLFLVTLPRTEKSQELFRLNNLCHIAIKVEAYKAQSGLTQCYNCQQFGHVWANCKQPPPTQGVPRKGKLCLHSSMLQLPVGGGRQTASRQLSGLQIRQGGAAKEKDTENTQNYHREGVLIKRHHPRCLLRGGTQRRRKAAATTSSDKSRSDGFYTSSRKADCTGPYTAEGNRSVSSGSSCKQSISGQYVESSNCSTADYDRGQWCSVRG